jgi:hypothetical protein
MRGVTSIDILDAWERGMGCGAARRALILLDLVASAGQQSEDPAGWPLGLRDARLLELREAAYGAVIEGVSSCPQCGSAQEFEVRTTDLKAKPPSDQNFALERGEHRVEYRLLTSRDLCSLEDNAARDDDMRARALSFCVTAATRAGVPVPPEHLPPELVDEMSDAMSRADPQSDINLAMQCTECGHCWSEPFDIASFLWTETDAWARRTLSDVHQLAGAYGWSEAEILSMSPRRRGMYLDLIGA